MRTMLRRCAVAVCIFALERISETLDALDPVPAAKAAAPCVAPGSGAYVIVSLGDELSVVVGRN